MAGLAGRGVKTNNSSRRTLQKKWSATATNPALEGVTNPAGAGPHAGPLHHPRMAIQLPGLSGKVAIVTAAASGIGQAIAVQLGRQGAHVIACDMSDASSTVSTITADGGRAEFESLDATDRRRP